MSGLATVGIVIGLVVIALMAVTPLLVDLNERHPPAEKDEPEDTAAHRRTLDLDGPARTILSGLTERSNRFARFADVNDHHIV